MNTWQQLLFGAAPALYNVQPSQWVGQQTAPAETGIPPAQPPQPSGQSMYGGGSPGSEWGGTGGKSPYGGTRNTPRVSDPQYWGGEFTPDLGWKDVMKAYGQQIGAGLLSGPGAAVTSMMRSYMNPTKDPTFQKSAQQYLDQHAPAASLSDIVARINEQYRANPLSKAFATDTARGALMGAGEFANQYGQASQQGLLPHQFAQSVTGMNMAGLNPNNMGNWNTAGSSPYSIANYAAGISQGRFARDGEVAQSLQRREANVQKRASSREWMESVLDGTTDKGFSEWARSMGENNTPSGIKGGEKNTRALQGGNGSGHDHDSRGDNGHGGQKGKEKN